MSGTTNTQDKALTATTFLQNKILTAAIARIKAQHTSAPLVATDPAALTIGFDYPDGHSTVRKFVNPFPETNTPAQIISGAASDSSDADKDALVNDPADDTRPSEFTNSDSNRHYLAMHDWKPETLKGLGEVWCDPISGGSHRIAVAIGIEDKRAARDAVI